MLGALVLGALVLGALVLGALVLGADAADCEPLDPCCMLAPKLPGDVGGVTIVTPPPEP